MNTTATAAQMQTAAHAAIATMGGHTHIDLGADGHAFAIGNSGHDITIGTSLDATAGEGELEIAIYRGPERWDRTVISTDPTIWSPADVAETIVEWITASLGELSPQYRQMRMDTHYNVIIARRVAEQLIVDDEQTFPVRCSYCADHAIHTASVLPGAGRYAGTVAHGHLIYGVTCPTTLVHYGVTADTNHRR